MKSLESYTNTVCELAIEEARLQMLLEKKEEIYAKYFQITSHIKEVVTDGGGYVEDKNIRYVHEIYDKDIGTGRSLVDEIEYQKEKVIKLKRYKAMMDKSLEGLKGIEYQLFKAIVIDGNTPTEAVEKVAIDTEKNLSTIWRYYSSIKKDVKRIRRYQKK